MHNITQRQARRQDLAAGGSKNRKEEPKTRRGGTFKKYSVGCMQQQVGQMWNMPGTTGPPASTALRRDRVAAVISLAVRVWELERLGANDGKSSSLVETGH